MVIGVNCFWLIKRIGGMRQYFFRLFRELLAKDSENSYVFFYFNQNREELEIIGNDKWKKDAILISDQQEVCRHLDKIDLYFCPFSALWPRPLPIPCVVTLHDIQEKYYPGFFDEKNRNYRAYHYMASTKAADQVITVSDFCKQSIAFHHKIPENKIHVAHMAVGEQYFRPDKIVNKDNLKLPDHFIYYPANRWLHKNHDNLLKALTILKRENGLEIQCVFTGFDYDNGYPLGKKIREYQLEKQIRSGVFISSGKPKISRRIPH